MKNQLLSILLRLVTEVKFASQFQLLFLFLYILALIVIFLMIVEINKFIQN